MTILKRTSIPCDLAESTYEWLSKELPYPDKTLVISTSLIEVAEKLNVNYEIDTELVRDQWYIKTPYGGIFSPGA